MVLRNVVGVLQWLAVAGIIGCQDRWGHLEASWCPVVLLTGPGRCRVSFWFSWADHVTSIDMVFPAVDLSDNEHMVES